MSEILGSNNNQETGSGNKLFTGLRQVKFLGINPDAAKLEEFYSKPPKKDPNYDVVEKNDFSFKPVSIFLRDVETDKIVTLKFSIGQQVKEQPINKEGDPMNYKVVTSTGNIKWACDSNKIVRSEFTGVEPLRMGEDTLIAFLKALTRYDYKAQDYIAVTTQEKLTASDLFKEDFTGFNKLTEIYGENTFIVMFTVNEGDDENYYQGISQNSDLFFADKYNNGVTDYHINKVKERFENGMSAPKPFNMFGTDFYTFETQVFDPKTSLGGVPKNSPVSAAPAWND